MKTEIKELGKLYGRCAYYKVLDEALKRTFRKMIWIIPLVIFSVFIFYFLILIIFVGRL